MKIKEIIVQDNYPFTFHQAEEELKGAVCVSAIVRPLVEGSIGQETVILAFYPDETNP